MSVDEVIERLEKEIKDSISLANKSMTEEDREFFIGQEIAYKHALRFVKEIKK